MSNFKELEAKLEKLIANMEAVSQRMDVNLAKLDKLVPREQPEPEIGDLCYFWDDNASYVTLAWLQNIDHTKEYPYAVSDYAPYQHCQPAEIDGKPNYPIIISQI